MATTKLTLSADSELVRQMKRLARERGTTVSAMFDRFARSMVRRDYSTEARGPLTAQALGLVHLPEDRTDRELLEEALAEKHRT